ncbi:hypothetical protein [uncultured Brevundimonas sp.]|uniref:hypothetical protein n=1 Tax=uncultured Brevundimonas sp. TaxID=213418 RepID=UPI0030EB3050|tara:strand:- start:26310 stop:26975 length:666 start_codon:yes stop_codon:yes gene_type:complete
MTQYPSEFQNGGGFDPVTPDVFFSLPPMLLAAFLLLLALAIVLTWFARDLFGRKDPDAADDIWTAISAACQSAMAANSDQLLARAKALREAINARLGPVLTLTDGLNKPLTALDKAIKGKSQDERATTTTGGSCAPHLTVLQNSRIVLKGDSAGDPATGSARSSPPATVRDMTDAERASALRSAIGAFHDHWSDKTLRLGELRKARHTLCHTAPVERPAHH